MNSYFIVPLEERLAEHAEWTISAASKHHRRPMYGQESLISLEILLSFLFSRQRLFLCLCLAPHSRTSFSSSTSFHSPYFSKVLSHTSPSKILLSMTTRGLSSSVLPHIHLPVPPMYFLFLLHFLIPYFLRSRTSHVCPALSLKILLSMPSRGPSSSVLPFLPYFPVLWILPWFSYIVSVMRLSSPYGLLEFS